MRVLAITKLFPNRLQPLAAAFNRQQFAALANLCDLEVVATIPWFPGARALSRWTNAGRVAAVPRRDRIAGMTVSHPRVLYVPKVGHSIAGALCIASLLPDVMARRGQVDVILASWAYPHGAAAVTLGRLLDAPVVVKLHGSDMNVIAKMPGPRRHLAWALPRAARVVAVSRALAETAVDVGVAPSVIDIVINGVDGELFYPRDRAAMRDELSLAGDGPLLLYVGWLERAKGILDLLDAFEAVRRSIPRATLVVVGDGSERVEVERRAAAIGGVKLAGARPHSEVARWMGACDVLALPSWNEGTPNVVLEALASGRRVVATAVGGIPDLLVSEGLGQLVPVRDAAALSTALTSTLSSPYDPARVAELGSHGTWQDSAGRLHASLAQAASR